MAVVMNMNGFSSYECRRNHSGFLVVTKTGLKGRTKNADTLVNSKVPVYLEDGKRMLCTPETLKVIGYYD
jgi:hypothetical protein